MKLYSEDQVKQIIANYNTERFVSTDELLEDLNLTPIELPSDEEIKKAFFLTYPNGLYEDYLRVESFIEGAKWIKKQILNQKK